LGRHFHCKTFPVRTGPHNIIKNGGFPMKLPITEKRARTIETTKNMLGLAAVVLGGMDSLHVFPDKAAGE
jgi:hypothetical protein